MRTAWLGLAWVIGACHIAVIVAVVSGGPLAARWPRLVWIHALVGAAVGLVFLLGADCPLTTWQKGALRRADQPLYEGGFIEHTVVRPLTGHGITPTVRIAIVATWVVPTLIGYTMIWRGGRLRFDRR